MLNYIEFLIESLDINISKTIIILVAIFLTMNVIGEILEFKGKVVPEFVKIRKFFARKKKEKEMTNELAETLKQANAALAEFSSHYNIDNITQRDEWIDWVNSKAKVYDNSIAELEKKLDKNNEITLSLLIDMKRSSIINFASKVIDEQYPVTREQFNRIFKQYREYEAIIKENDLTNGEVDIAYRIITESYEKHMINHSFIEDVRGYKSAK